MTPPKLFTTPYPLATEDRDDSVYVEDTLGRVRRLEQQTSDILPTLGKVAQAVDNICERFDVLGKDVKDIAEGFMTFRVETATYGARLKDLEDKTSCFCADRLEELEAAKLKAEGVIEAAKVKADALLEEKRKDNADRRNRLLTLVGTAVFSVVTAAVLTWLGLR